MNQQQLLTTITSIQSNYTADQWQRSYPNGMNAAALYEAIDGLTTEQIEHGLTLVSEQHAKYPIGIAQFANLCKSKRVHCTGDSNCEINGCPVSTSLPRCEFHPYSLSAMEIDLVTQALNDNRELVEYYQWLHIAPVASITDPYQEANGNEVWPDWSAHNRAIWSKHQPNKGEHPMDYKQRILTEIKSIIERHRYGVAA